MGISRHFGVDTLRSKFVYSPCKGHFGIENYTLRLFIVKISVNISDFFSYEFFGKNCPDTSRPKYSNILRRKCVDSSGKQHL